MHRVDLAGARDLSWEWHEVGEQHLDLLSLPARDQTGTGFGDMARELQGALVD